MSAAPRPVHVVALLDPPSPRSFASVPFVERDGSTCRIHGFRPQPGPELAAEEFERVVAEGSARPADIVAEALSEQLAAGMLGLAFIDACRRLSLPVPQVARTAHLLPRTGWVWLDHPDRIEAAREAWVLAAAWFAFRRRAFDVAELMQWAAPLHAHTGAAVWHTLPPRLAAEELVFQARLRRDAGAPIAVPALQEQFEDIRDFYLIP